MTTCAHPNRSIVVPPWRLVMALFSHVDPGKASATAAKARTDVQSIVGVIDQPVILDGVELRKKHLNVAKGLLICTHTERKRGENEVGKQKLKVTHPSHINITTIAFFLPFRPPHNSTHVESAGLWAFFWGWLSISKLSAIR